MQWATSSNIQLYHNYLIEFLALFNQWKNLQRGDCEMCVEKQQQQKKV